MTIAELKDFAKRLASQGSWAGPWVEREQVERLIRSLRPRGTIEPLVRIGAANDGGYLVPDDFDGVGACVSPGVEAEIAFDQDMAERGIDVYMADASVAGPPIQNDRFNFTKKFLDLFEDDGHMRLDSLCASIPDAENSDLVLQMDIEGAEWRVLLDADAGTLERFRIMVIEFHGLQQIFGRYSFDLFRLTFSKILRSHSVVHIHPNNCCAAINRWGVIIPPMIEVTFYRNDRSFADTRRASYPHPLDADCDPGKPAVALPAMWYE